MSNTKYTREDSARYVGQSVVRVDARDKVMGRTKYAGDIKLRNMCYGKILLSEYPRARVVKIDTTKAEKIKGVKAVITYKNIKGTNLYGYDVHHRPVLVPEGGETRFLGDSIAFMVAENAKSVKEAIAVIEVTYEPLRPISSVDEAMKRNAPLIHENYKGNICATKELIKGNVEKGFEECAVIVEEDFVVPRQEHAFLEPEAGVAYLDDGRMLHVYSCLQDPYAVIEDVHYALGIPKSRIHVVGTPVGGAFGGKLDTTMQVHLATMAYVCQCPVSLVFTREESFLFHPKRHPGNFKTKIGATKEGEILAYESNLILDAGPYSGRTPEVLGYAVGGLAGPYRIPNLKLTGTAYYTNNLDSGAFRGFGEPQAALARECIFDRLANELDMDPLELRKRNFLREGDPIANPVLKEGAVSLEKLTQVVCDKLGELPKSNSREKRIGRGFCFDMPLFDVSAIPLLGKSGVGIAVEMFSDGSVCVYAGGTELGQGITTVLAQIAAEELSVPVNMVMVRMSDTATCPRAGRTSASRLTYVLGNALLLATEKLRSNLLKEAAQKLEITYDALEMKDGEIYAKRDPNQAFKVADIASLCAEEGVNLREEAWFKHPENRYMYGHTFMTTAADVEVDLNTGHLRILNIVNVHDSGKVINPILAKGQFYGGTIQALGYALMEDMVVENGYCKTPTFTEYLIPTSMDIPDKIIAEMVETPYPTGPYGAKGLAEHSTNSTAPAILNAVFNATGFAPKKIPLLPEHIVMGMKRPRSG